ncbi:xanthine dehydrogenase family protein subunit M [Thalassococcus sp. S3]|uniref:FAD binding domain-containing protein n=1 Tax=Thalassococcus sp. S3 TaxID=2017482 RepID=UPI001023FA57|nr:FAD binding domain-containing protein [Thalassococcus sp. S3]QBF32028.1 xanthine dehydrogenase [Thalassococcus sp. S3]
MAGQYLRPDRLTDALDALAAGGLTVAAGCTDLFPATERKSLPGDILDITGMAELRGIARVQEGLWIGATTTWTDLLRTDLPPAFDGLKLAAREVGATQIQNRGTIAGNLCNASPAADGVPPLLTLDAQVELQSAKARRVLPLAEFLRGPRDTAREASELLTAILIPDAALTGTSHFLKLGARRYLVISIAMTAARVVMTDGLVTEAALAIGSCGPVATRLPEAEAALIGRPLDPSVITDALVAGALSPIDDVRADAAYRSDGAAELMRRTLTALDRQGQEAA